jgi:para-nitrobenzyl esterase
MPRPIRTFRAALFCLMAIPSAFAQKNPDTRTIRVESGKLFGAATADGKVIAYKGIPYAQPPVEQLRWQPPQPAGRWQGTLAATSFGPHCVQFGSYPDMVFHDPGESEDCLTLNIWTPADAKLAAKKSGAKNSVAKNSGGLPVMVWIYGGGFQTGGTSENRQTGEFLAHRGVIVVSMNYRLGVFGFFAHPELTAESPAHASGNYGLMDQAAAIAWVRRNIAAFGGDPANITIFGQSAGSQSVSALVASPVANGLFAKAIGHSGSEFPRSGGGGLATLHQAEQAGSAWATRTLGSSSLFYLRGLTTDDIAKAAAKGSVRFNPIVDGYFLPDSLPNIYAAGKQAHIPVIGGWVANEARPSTPATADSFTAQAHAKWGANAADFLALFPAKTDAEAAQSADDLATANSMGYPTWAWLEAQQKTGGAPVYRYFFGLGSPGDRNHNAAMGAFHSDDIEYVFGTLDSRPEMKIRPEDRALSELMQQYWINFAKSKTGDPNGPGLPQWPAYNPATNWQVMRLDVAPAAQPDPQRGRYLFLDSARSNGSTK